MRRIAWDNNPDIGFWIENDPVRLYYPTTVGFVEEIAKKGLIAPNTGWVLTWLDPVSAFYSISDTHDAARVLIVCDIPTKWLFEHMDQRLGENTPDGKKRLLDKNSFTKWSKNDHLYYADVKIRIASAIPVRYITGFMMMG